MIKGIEIEVVVNNVLDDAIEAEKLGADRFELVSAIELGGLTPNIGVLKLIKEKTNVEIACMNRPRGGNFVYTDLEFEEMLVDTEEMIKAGADGIVFGFLNEDNSVDEAKTKKMIDLIHSFGKEAIFHKASDRTADIKKATELLISLGIDRIMTNGQASNDNLIPGMKIMADLADNYGDKVEFLLGGGVRANNIHELLEVSHAKQVHMTSKKTSDKGYTTFDPEQFKEIIGNI